MQKSKDQLEEKLKRISNENFRLRKLNKEIEVKQTKLDSRNSELQTKNDSLGRKLGRLRERAEKELTSISSEVTRLEKQVDCLKEEQKRDRKEFSNTKESVCDLWTKMKAKNAEISSLRLSVERCLLELNKIDRESKASQTERDQAKHFLSIKKTFQIIMDKDSTFCETDERSRDEILQDSEVSEMVNSILLEFTENKQNHITDVQKCITGMEDYKKKLYKKAKAKLLEAKNDLSESECKVKDLQKENKSKDKALAELQKKDAKEIQTRKQKIEQSEENMTVIPGRTSFQDLIKIKDKKIDELTIEVFTTKKNFEKETEKFESAKVKEENIFQSFKELREKEGNDYLHKLSTLEDSLKERDALIAILQRFNFILDNKTTKESTASPDVVKKLKATATIGLKIARIEELESTLAKCKPKEVKVIKLIKK